jgi:pimeloyl-ACP methyl ester carboxylesterase
MVAAAHTDTVSRLAIVEVGPPTPPPYALEPAGPPEPKTRRYTSLEEAFEEEWRDVPRADLGLHRHNVRHGLRQDQNGEWLGREDPRLQTATWQGRLRPGAGAEWAALSEIRCPTLIVRGAYGLSAERADAMTRAIPASSVVEIPDAGHNLPLENPAALIKALLGLLLGPPE